MTNKRLLELIHQLNELTTNEEYVNFENALKSGKNIHSAYESFILCFNFANSMKATKLGREIQEELKKMKFD